MRGNDRRIAVSCGVDLGSTNTKVVAVDQAGRVRARSIRATPRRDGDQLIDATRLLNCLEEMIEEVCGDRFAVAAVATGGIGEDGILIDSSLQALLPALSWFDHRRQSIFQELRPQLTDDDRFGVPTDSARTLVGWAWVAQHRTPTAAYWVSLTDFAATAWSRTPFVSDTLAARTAAWTPAAGWDPARVETTLKDITLLPPVVPAGTILGPLTSARLKSAGLVLPGTAVVVGGHDHPIAGWGVDRAHPGAILDSMGTAEVVVAHTPATDLPRTGAVDTAPSIRQPGTTVLRVEELARNVAWACQDPTVGRAIQSLLAGTAHCHGTAVNGSFTPGRRGGGTPRYAPDAPNEPTMRACAVLGALARVGAEAIDAVADTLGGASDVYAAGGWSRSRGWMALKNRVLDQSLRVIPEPEVAAVSAALLAADAIGWDLDAGHCLGI